MTGSSLPFEEQYRICSQAEKTVSTLEEVTPGSVFFAVKRKIPPGGIPKLAWHIFRWMELHANWLLPALARMMRFTRWGDDLSRIEKQELDGNAYASRALARGAAYVFVDNPAVAKNERYILVPDVLEQLYALAIHHRKQFDIPVIAITGSVGKTTTTSLIESVMSQKYRLLATKRSKNSMNEIPATVLSLQPQHEALVLEFGGVALGTIRKLCEIAQPTHGVLTRIGIAHLATYGSVEGIRAGKWELVDFLTGNNGHFFVNFDDDWLRSQDTRGVETTSYGSGTPNEEGLVPQIVGEYIDSDPYLRLNWQDPDEETRHLSTRLVGKYNLENVLCSIAVGLHFGVDPDRIEQAIEALDPVFNRSQMITHQGVNYILDSGSINPTSLDAALDNFERLDMPDKYVLLGDMLRLGIHTDSAHQAAIAKVKKLDIQGAIFVGPAFWRNRDPEAGTFFPNTPALRKWWNPAGFKGATILVKSAVRFNLVGVLGLGESIPE